MAADLQLALRIKADLDSATQKLKRLNKNIGQTGDSAGRTSRRADTLEKSISRTGDAAARASRRADTLNASFRRTSVQAASLLRSVRAIGPLLAAFGGYRALAGIRDAGVAIQQAEARFVAATNSTTQAASDMQFVRQTSQALGLDLIALSGNFASLTAAAQGTRLAGQRSRDILLGIADAAAALQLNSEQTTGALRALEQMISKGNVQAEELRGQLGERLPGAFNLAAQAMGVSTQELNRMLDRGEVMADDLLPKLAARLSETYGRNARKNSRLFVGEVNRMKNAFVDLGAAIGEAGVLDFLTRGARVTSAITRNITERITGVDRVTELTREIAEAEKHLGIFADQPVRPRFSIDLSGLRDDIEAMKLELSRERFLISQRTARIDRAFPQELRITAPPAITKAAFDAAARIQDQIDALQGVEKSMAEAIESDLLEQKFGQLPEEGVEMLRALAAEYDALKSSIATDDALRGALRDLADAEESLLPPLEAARVQADRWRNDMLSSLDEAGLAHEAYAARVDAVYQRMIAAPQQRQVDEIRRYAEELRRQLADARGDTGSAFADTQTRIAEDFTGAPQDLRDEVLAIAEKIDMQRQLNMETLAMSEALQSLRQAQDSLADPYTRAVAEATRWRDETLRLLQESGQDNKEYADQVEAVYSEIIAQAAEDAADRQLQAATDWRSGAVRALRAVKAEAEDTASSTASLIRNAFRSAEDALTDFIVTGRASFGDFVRGIAADLIRLQIRTHFIAPLAGALEGWFGVGHSGMIVGQPSGVRRRVDPAIFANAPRFHRGGLPGGLRSGEVPIIANRTEGIFTAEQMQALGGLARRGTQVFIEFVNAGTPQQEVSRSQEFDQAGNLVISVVTDDLRRNGRLSQSIQRTFGVRRTAT